MIEALASFPKPFPKQVSKNTSTGVEILVFLHYFLFHEALET